MSSSAKHRDLAAVGKHMFQPSTDNHKGVVSREDRTGYVCLTENDCKANTSLICDIFFTCSKPGDTGMIERLSYFGDI